MEITLNEKHNNKKIEGKQEQEEKTQTLEVEYEVFENIIRSLMIEERKKKKDIKKKTKEIKRLKNEMKNTMKMVDGMKDECNKKVRENGIKIEQVKTTVAEAEACIEMVKKEEHDKVTENKQHENVINATKLNHN